MEQPKDYVEACRNRYSKRDVEDATVTGVMYGMLVGIGMIAAAVVTAKYWPIF